MSKIITLFIKFLNRINKINWKIIVFLIKFIKIDEIKHLDDKPQDVKYRLFNVDEPAIIEPFVKLEHKDYKELIKDNNIKPVKRRNDKDININVKCCPHCGYQLNLIHHREDFDVYRCPNNKCPFYLKNKSTMNAHDRNFYKEHSEKIKLHYIYRKFNIDFPTLKLTFLPKKILTFTKILFSFNIICKNMHNTSIVTIWFRCFQFFVQR